MENLAEIVAHLDALQAEIQPLRPLKPDALQRLMQKLRLDWNFHSNHLEGNSLTYGETKTLLLYGTTARNKPLKDHLDIQGHNEAVEWIMDLLRGEEVQRPLTENFVRELHKLILKEPYLKQAQTSTGLPTQKRIEIGQYKTEPNHVRTPTDEIFYYASPEETPAMMHDLMVWYEQESEKQDLHPLVLAVGFHYRFVRIHPFDDGNGRMARLLMNFILMKFHYPPAIVPTEQREDYIDALHKVDITDELEPFAVYVGKCLIRSLELMLKAARGEAIEEPDDFDKKIALLQARVKGEAEGQIQVKKDSFVLTSLLENELYPFLKKFADAKIGKLATLFFEGRVEICNLDYADRPKPDLLGITSRLEQELSKFIYNDFAFVVNEFKISFFGVSALAFNFFLKGFLNSGFSPFNLQANIICHFEDFIHPTTTATNSLHK